MQIEIKLDDTCKEPRVLVVTDRMTDEIDALIEKLSEKTPQLLTGFRDGTLRILEPPQILRIYTDADKTVAATESGVYTMRLRLYELESRLAKDGFVRISNAEIINLRRVQSFDLSLAGTICVTLADGSRTYASRRYVSKIKQVLGL